MTTEFHAQCSEHFESTNCESGPEGQKKSEGISGRDRISALPEQAKTSCLTSTHFCD